MRQQMLQSNQKSHQKRGSAGVRLQVRQLRQLPQLGGNGIHEIIIEKESVQTQNQKEGKASAVRQQMLYSNITSHQKRGSGGVRLQLYQLRQHSQLGGNRSIEIIIVKVTARTWTQKRESVSDAAEDAL